MIKPDTKLRDNESLFDEAVARYVNEIDGWVGLGNLSEARHIAEAALRVSDSPELHYKAMMIAISFGDIEAAALHALVLIDQSPCDDKVIDDTAMVLDYAGHSREAYQLTMECRRAGIETSRYNLACRACSLGRMEEALRAILGFFQFQVDANSSTWRKVVLDSELREVWDCAADRPVSPADALRWANCPLELLLGHNQPELPPRLLDLVDLPLVPERFVPFLRGVACNAKCFDAGEAERHPEVFRQYLDWEHEATRPAREALTALRRRLRARYNEMLPAMVAFCAGRGRPGTARYLMRQFLRFHKGLTPDEFPSIPGLEYWTGEWRRLHAVDPEGTYLLIARRSGGEDGGDFLENEFPRLPGELRESGLGWFVRLCELLALRRPDEALAAILKALAYWPPDEALWLNIVSCLADLGRWDEAERVVNHPGFLQAHAVDPAAGEWIRSKIACKKKNFLPLCVQRNSFFPTPSFGLMDHAEDVRFLKAWHRGALARLGQAGPGHCKEA